MKTTGWLCLICYFLAIIIAPTLLFAPLHEMGHGDTAWKENKDSELINRNTIRVYGKVSWYIAMAGFLSEWTTFTLVGFICIFIAIKRPGWLIPASFCAGYMTCIIFNAMGSTDFDLARSLAIHMDWSWLLITLPVTGLMLYPSYRPCPSAIPSLSAIPENRSRLRRLVPKRKSESPRNSHLSM